MRGAEAGGKLASTQIITYVHTYAVAEGRRSGSKIRSATNGSNTQFSASASKPRTPTHLCPQEMAEPPVSALRMCEHTRGGGVGMSKPARFCSATTPRRCERSLTLYRQQTIACTSDAQDLSCQMISSGHHELTYLRPRQNGQCFTDNIFKDIFLDENDQILIKISLKCVPNCSVDNETALVWIKAWHQQVMRYYLNQWGLFYWSIYASLCLKW